MTLVLNKGKSQNDFVEYEVGKTLRNSARVFKFSVLSSIYPRKGKALRLQVMERSDTYSKQAPKNNLEETLGPISDYEWEVIKKAGIPATFWVPHKNQQNLPEIKHEHPKNNLERPKQSKLEFALPLGSIFRGLQRIYVDYVYLFPPKCNG